jgi:hypothetical protein
MQKHELEENTIQVAGQATSGEVSAGLVDVSASCTCGCPLSGVGSTLLEAVEDLEACFAKHVAQVTPRATPGGAGVGDTS